MTIRILIRTDGTITNIPGPLGAEQIRELIDAHGIDTVALRHLGNPLHMMIVDDHGYDTETVEHGPGHYELRPTRARKPVNSVATAMYRKSCRPGTTHEIVGDVLVLPDNDFYRGLHD